MNKKTLNITVTDAKSVGMAVDLLWRKSLEEQQTQCGKIKGEITKFKTVTCISSFTSHEEMA